MSSETTQMMDKMANVQPLPWTAENDGGLFDANDVPICCGLTAQEAHLIATAVNANATLTEQVRVLRAFVRHDASCWFRGLSPSEAPDHIAEWPGGRPHVCTCGLDAALAATQPTDEVKR